MDTGSPAARPAPSGLCGPGGRGCLADPPSRCCRRELRPPVHPSCLQEEKGPGVRVWGLGSQGARRSHGPRLRLFWGLNHPPRGNGRGSGRGGDSRSFQRMVCPGLCRTGGWERAGPAKGSCCPVPQDGGSCSWPPSRGASLQPPPEAGPRAPLRGVVSRTEGPQASFCHSPLPRLLRFPISAPGRAGGQRPPSIPEPGGGAEGVGV